MSNMREIAKTMLVVGTPSLGALMFVLPAYAQTASDGADSGAGQVGGANVDEIVVTARRQDENLQTVPISVAAFSQDALTQRSIVSAFDLSRAVPGLSVSGTQASTAVPSFSIRGRGTNYGASGGSVEAYFAEVPLSSPFLAPSLPIQFFDLTSLQVLKGPQGTLFGRNTTGGAVLVVPAAPADQFEGYARVQGGTFGNVQLEGAVNLPLAAGKAGLRVAGFFWKRNGYMHTIGGATDIATGQTLPAQSYMNQDVKELRATLRLRPFEDFENTTIFTYHYDKNKSSPGAGYNLFNSDGKGTFVGLEPLSGLPIYRTFGFGTRTNNVNIDLTKPSSNAWAIINTTSYDLTPDLVVKNIFGYIKARGTGSRPIDIDGGSFSGSQSMRTPYRNENRQLTDELQILGKSFGNRLDWTLGGMVDTTRQPGGSHANWEAYSITGAGPYSSAFRQTKVTSYSLYVSGSFDITEKLRLSAGFRRTWDDFLQRDQRFTGPTPATGLVTGNSFDPSRAPIIEFAKKFSGNTYNIGLDYQPSTNLLVYASYRHGYKRGGVNAGTPNGFDPETIDNFNLGLKHQFEIGDVKGRLAIEGFYDQYYDQQVSYFGPNSSNVIVEITSNVPKTIYRGFEADLSLEPTRWLSLNGAFSFIDAYNKSWPDLTLAGAVGDLSVNPVPNVSKYKTSVTAKLHGELPNQAGELSFAPTINYQSRFYTNALTKRLPLVEQALFGFDFNSTAVGSAFVPGTVTADLRIEWNHMFGSRVSSAVNVTNVTNKTYLLDAVGVVYFNVDGLVYGPPRMAAFEIRTEF